MADLRIESPKTTGEFAALLASAGVTLPLRLADESFDEVVDAEGRLVFAVDVAGLRPDEHVEAIALWLILAANTCGGFRAATVEGSV